MELQMKAICEGTQTRNDVVQRNIEQYRAVFARTSQQMGVLKTVREQFRFEVYMGIFTRKKITREIIFRVKLQWQSTAYPIKEHHFPVMASLRMFVTG